MLTFSYASINARKALKSLTNCQRSNSKLVGLLHMLLDATLR